jgi:hypothetical protein
MGDEQQVESPKPPEGEETTPQEKQAEVAKDPASQPDKTASQDTPKELNETQKIHKREVERIKKEQDVNIQHREKLAEKAKAAAESKDKDKDK